MKKLILLIFVGILPLFGFGQTNLVRWNGANLQPNAFLIVNNGTISANAVSGTFVTDNYTDPFQGFRGSNYNTSQTTPDYTNFMEFAIKANTGNSIALQNFKFTYARGQGGPKKFEVRYSTDNSIGTAIGGITSVSSTPTLKTVDLNGVTVQSGQTLYIRVYPFDRQDPGWNGGTFHIKHGTAWSGQSDNGTGPTIRGTVSAVAAPCTPSTAPTAISGNSTICSGTNVNLQATGGSEGTNNAYQWGTGTVGQNIIAGQTSAILSHVPTTTTTYWVRKVNCNTSTAAVTKTVTVGFGNPSVYTNNFWTGYAYTYTGEPAATNYIGFVEENETFDRNNENSSISGRGINNGRNNLCSTPSDNFLVKYRMQKTFAAGTYTFTVGGDDGYRLSIDGGQTWIISNYSDHAYATTSETVCFNGTTPTNLVLEYYEKSGQSRVSFAYVNGGNVSAPTLISGSNQNCVGETLTLTASGGTGSVFQWGTGTVGQNIINNATTATINVTFNGTTTYWVRRVISTCAGTNTTAAITKTVTLTVPAGDPSQFGLNTWNVYAFSGQSMTPSVANYLGYYTQNTLGADSQDIANNGWDFNLSPSSSAGWVGCTVPNDNFTFIHKRKGFPAGSYNLSVLNYDDATRILINGVQVRDYTGWYGGNANFSDNLGLFCLSANSTVEIITNESAGLANFKMSIVASNAVYANSAWNENINPANKSVEIQNNLTLTNDLTVCACTIKAGTTLIIPSNKTLTVSEDIVVEPGAQIIVENNGSLVQIDDNATYTGSVDSFVMKRNTQPVYRLDFTYWSSPIKASSAFTLKKLSPLTLASKYYKWADAWVAVNAENEVMTPAKGYIVRAPQTFSVQGVPGAQAKIDSIAFKGVPNNGLVKIAVDGPTQGVTNSPKKWNLIGNPYPSALNVEAFYNNLNNQSKLKGTIYLWTHNTPIGLSTGFNYSASDYATYNMSGGTATTNASDGNTPSGYIAAGQAFFVEGVASGEVEFNNSMRVTQGNLNNQFFRPAPSQPVENWEITGKHRVWLNLTSTQNHFNQILVGYIENATNGLDTSYDGEVFSGGAVSLYSILDSKNLTIQGRALPFSNQDEVTLGYKTTLTGTLKISIDHFDGVFEAQNVYLKDNLLNIVHNLKDSDYEFTTVPGTFNERFVLQYLPQETLGTDVPAINNNSIVVFNNNNQINIKSSEQVISKVEIYDLQGRVIFTKNNIDGQSFATQSLSVKNQMVIVKVITDNNSELVKKVMLK